MNWVQGVSDVVKVGRLLFFQRIQQLEFELRQVQASVSTLILQHNIEI